MTGYDKGAKGERELVNMFDDHGYVGLRAPSSGSTTERALPDILVGKNGRSIAVEAKRVGDGYCYLDGEEVDALYYFSEHFGAEAWIAVRYDRDDWFFLKREQLHKTDSGNYRVKRDLKEEGQSFHEII